ncbi:Os02g0219950 [Oryza sativa Japonica Group]|uniref:Os02g0219950 protein n=1 Tax=Oryza sativa subsp. japonica TaxID=39947 RepID=A0A0P0VGN3_ORYSJ|nr:hypothetical protein EE612_009816 [Oryza sativa]BAS77693.1 Os02g0219950 [Oryza sativa Japonica Group]
MPERLAADAGVGERAGDGDAEVVRPHARRQAVFQRRAEDVGPQLLTAGVHVRRRACAARGHVDAAAARRQRTHVDHDAAGGERLPAGRVALPARRHGERRRRRRREPDELRDLGRRGRVEHRLRRGRHDAAEVRRRPRRRVAVDAELRGDTVREEIAGKPTGDDDGQAARHDHERDRTPCSHLSEMQSD